METRFQQALGELPHLPEEVFRLWLDEPIRAHGWPPGDAAAWKRAFFGRDLGFVKALRWLKQPIALAPEELAPGALEEAIRIVEARVRGGAAETPGPDTSPVVLVSTFDGYEVAHGRQRLAAMLLAGARRGETGFYPRTVEAWIGAIRA